MTRRMRLSLYAAGVLLGLLLVAVAAVFLILPSRWFEERVRDRIIAEVEKSSGGRVEIGAFHFDWRRLEATVTDFVLHGKEPPGQDPLFRAPSAKVGLKVISALKRDIDIASIHIEQPRINILVDEQGRTNFPTPRLPRDPNRNPLQSILDLAVRDVVVTGGLVHYNDRTLPLDVQGRNLEVHLAYDVRGPQYAGTVDFEAVRIAPGDAKPIEASLSSRIRVQSNALVVDSATVATPRSNVTLAGRISDFRDPHLHFDVKASGDLAELGETLRLPRPHTGTVTFAGTAAYSAAESVQLAGRVSARGLSVEQGGFRLVGISGDSNVRLGKDQVFLDGLTAKALDGSLKGSASITNGFRSLKVNARVSGLSIRKLAAAEGIQRPPWDGSVSGPIELTASLGKGAGLKAAGTLAISPIAGQPPLEGRLEFDYDQQAQRLRLGSSYLSTSMSRVDFAGTLGERLQAHLETRDLNDLLPIVAMAAPQSVPRELPVRIAPGGRVVFEGVVSGPTRQARVDGTLNGERLVVRNQTVDTAVAQVQASETGLHIHSAAIVAGETRIEGSADLGLHDWKMAGTSPVGGKLKLQNVALSRLLSETGRSDIPVEGTLSADIVLQGTVDDPAAVAQVMVVNPAAYGEKWDRLRAEVRYSGNTLQVLNGQLEAGAGRVSVAGAYHHTAGDWKTGQADFDLGTRNLVLSQIQAVRNYRPGTNGKLDVSAKGTLKIQNGELLPATLVGGVSLRNLVVDDRSLGDLEVEAATANNVVAVKAKGNLRGSQVTGSAQFELTGDYKSRGELAFTPMALSVIQDLATATRGGTPMPFDGVVEGRVTFAGPAKKPSEMTARIELPTLEMVPSRQTRNRDQQRDIALRNQGPIVADVDAKGIHIRSAKFVGTDTNLELSGTVSSQGKSPWDLRVNGTLNLSVLDEFNPDLITSGVTTVNATVRGSLQQPQVVGRLELKNASLYTTDVPNGFDQVNGVVVFDANRATIEKITGVTGGGRITFSGFIAYGKGEPTFRLQGRADGVRVRYPEGVSTSANAALNLTGSRSHSVLSGTVTVLRAVFNPNTDLGGLIAGAAKPVQTPSTPNPYLRDMYLDVRVETVPNLVIQSSLSSNLQAEADLRIRGTAAKPAVLGRATINQGEIQFFGNKYQINRGEIGFYNPVRIEPSLNMDLETKVRGVTVNISFTGMLPNKLNFSYRSDPPLQTNEIVALLAVGRDPTSTSGLGGAQAQSQSTGIFSSAGTSSLLGQAIAAPVSNRLQRFFGVSRLKLDPSLTGIQTNPARLGLTIEQQISRDITVTYVTNLTDANQQIVRVEWDLNRNWSVVALREENGLFGIDFEYKKRFK